MSAALDESRVVAALAEMRGLLVQRFDAVDKRIDAVERRLDAVEMRLTKLEEGSQKHAVDLAKLEGRVSQLPTSIQMLGFVLAVLVISGLVRIFAP